jgi:hypothetical protein
MLAGCASAGGTADVPLMANASGSPYFSLSAPRAYKTRGGLELAGRVCRRARTTLLSPSRVRLEHVLADGSVGDVAHAYVGSILRNPDEACAGYYTRVSWTLGEGEQVRACFGHGRPCLGDAPKKALPVNPPKVAPAAPLAPTSNR